MQKTQSLLAPEQYSAIIAKQQQRLAALAIIEQHRQTVLQRRLGQPLPFDVVALIEQMRDERDEELIYGRSNSI
ncbi:MAG: hypothetical protein U0350_37760 [Caldilineaceae bacterium]